MQTAELGMIEDQIVEDYRGGGGKELSDAAMFAVYGTAEYLVLDAPYFIAALVVVGAGVLFAGMIWQRKIVYPRVGYARLRKERGKRRLKVQLGLTFMATAVMLVMFAAVAHFAKPHLPPRVPGDSPYESVFAITFCTYLTMIAGMTRKLRDLFLITLWATALMLMSGLWHENIAWAIFLSAAVALVLGVRKLRRFLKENPVLEAEAADE